MISVEQKAQIYGQLLNDHTRLHNQINEIKGQNIELNQKQLMEVRQLEQKQLQIMQQIHRLMS
jgi:hypothetical protein